MTRPMLYYSARRITLMALFALIMYSSGVGSTGTNMHNEKEDEFFPFTECDHVFDSAHPSGRFSFPIIPPAHIAVHDETNPDNEFDAADEDERESNERYRNHNNPLAENHPFVYNQKYFFDGEIRHLSTAQLLPNNIQCLYTFIAGKGQRVRLEFSEFQLAGTTDNCDLEYVDIYSELRSPADDLLSASLGGRYCGTVAPHVRISLYHVLVLVFHSRIGSRRSEQIRLRGQYEFIPDELFSPGQRILGSNHCAFQIDSGHKKQGTILSPTYPGTYPKNFRCLYLLKGSPGERIRLYFRDFDVYFGGEHCPYDALTIHDGHTRAYPILRKVCGLQQRLEVFSFDSSLLLEFNSTDMAKNDPRGFAIDYEFSSRFVDVRALTRAQPGVSHMLGTECDIRILSNRESVHEIASPNFPNMYPANTTCTYIFDGLQGDQNLEKVILTFITFSLDEERNEPKTAPTHLHTSTGTTTVAFTGLESSSVVFSTSPAASSSSSEDCTSGSFVGMALNADSIKTVLSMTEESVYDVLLCGQIANGSADLGPYVSLGPRIVLMFGSADPHMGSDSELDASRGSSAPIQHGFKARVEFKTDFGVPGEAMGDSNVCMFRFTEKLGSFNSPRYPANYPLDTNCTYLISGEPDEEILLYFTQFALFEEGSKYLCNDYLEIYDVLEDANGRKRHQLQAKHCWTMFPGPIVSTFGAHEMHVVFNSDSFGTANGFNAIYKIRKARKEDVPTKSGPDPNHCGQLIQATQEVTTGYFMSPGFPVKYNKDQLCDWEIRARDGHQILLQLTKMDVEGEITDIKTSCMNAVIVIHLNYRNRSEDLAICGTNPAVLVPIVTAGNSIRISFLTAPEKVNGLTGFNFTWSEVRVVQSDSECADENHYLCSYTRLCISASLRCNGDENCGQNDDTDEAHCNIAEKATDMRTILVAATFSGFIFLFIFGFFCFLFKKKLERKEQHKRRGKLTSTRRGATAGGVAKAPAAPAKSSAFEHHARQQQHHHYHHHHHGPSHHRDASEEQTPTPRPRSGPPRHHVNHSPSLQPRLQHFSSSDLPYNNEVGERIPATRDDYVDTRSTHRPPLARPCILVCPDSATRLADAAAPFDNADNAEPIVSVNPEFVSDTLDEPSAGSHYSDAPDVNIFFG